MSEIDDIWVQGPADFKKYSLEDVTDAVEKWRDVVGPAVAKGLGQDYFRDLDMQAGLSVVGGFERVFQTFYVTDPIRLSPQGSRFTVDNGSHRLYVARQLGIINLPIVLAAPP